MMMNIPLFSVGVLPLILYQLYYKEGFVVIYLQRLIYRPFLTALAATAIIMIFAGNNGFKEEDKKQQQQ